MFQPIQLARLKEKHGAWNRWREEYPDIRPGLSHSDLSHMDLQGYNLSHVRLYRVRLDGADLRGADLSHANLTASRLDGADLRGADLSHANLTASLLRFANGRQAHFTHANLSYVNLASADLSGAQLCEADLTCADLRGACLDGADLRGANLFETHLEQASVQGVDVAQTVSRPPAWRGDRDPVFLPLFSFEQSMASPRVSTREEQPGVLTTRFGCQAPDCQSTMELELTIQKTTHSAHLVCAHYMPDTLSWMRPEREAADVEAILRQGDADLLYWYNQAYVPFYCPACHGVYCRFHMRFKEVTKEYDPFPDYWYGNCPYGHGKFVSADAAIDC